MVLYRHTKGNNRHFNYGIEGIVIRISKISFNDINYDNCYEFTYIASQLNINNNSLKRIISKLHNKDKLSNVEHKAVLFIVSHCTCTYATDWEKLQIQEFSRLLGVNINYITDIVKLFYVELSTI